MDRKDLLNHDYAPGGLMRSARQNPAFMFAVRTLARFRQPPFMVLGLAAAAIIASFIPITASVYARFAKNTEPRVHLIQDMDNQAKYKAQAASPVFEDGRAMRLPVPGTVARGELITDEAYSLGYVMDEQGNVVWVEGMPDALGVDGKLMQRGRELYNRFCWLCHGYDGYGNGPIHVRAVKGQNALWVTPSSLHDETRLGRADGHLYNTINNGIRNMAGYGTQIRDPKDRWAIVAYVRALQLSQSVPAGEVDPSLIAGAEVRPATIDGNPPVVEEDAPAEETAEEPAETAVDDFADQLSSVDAAGVYELRAEADDIPVITVSLDEGDPIGFRRDDAGRLLAVYGDDEIALAENAVEKLRWRRQADR